MLLVLSYFDGEFLFMLSCQMLVSYDKPGWFTSRNAKSGDETRISVHLSPLKFSLAAILYIINYYILGFKV